MSRANHVVRQFNGREKNRLRRHPSTRCLQGLIKIDRFQKSEVVFFDSAGTKQNGEQLVYFVAVKAWSDPSLAISKGRLDVLVAICRTTIY